MDEITETRTGCGFRENMIQEANKPCDEVALGWLVCGHLESLIQDVMTSWMKLQKPALAVGGVRK